MSTSIKLSDLKGKMHAVCADYRKGLDAMAKSKERPMGFKKTTIEDLAAGHEDGVRNAVAMLRAASLLAVDEAS